MSDDKEFMNRKEDEAFSKRVHQYKILFEKIKKEVKKLVVGQEEVVHNLIEALIANGHVLIEGVPGTAKTTLIRTLSVVTGCQFSRIQFTPDLLPTDIVGITTYEEGRGFYTIKGPVFSNFVLADEINRAPPKVQSALLESMAEKQATIGKQTFPLPKPFFVMATQNPVENLGTYQLPEAQVDRFLYKLFMDYPTMKDEMAIIHKNLNLHSFDSFNLKPILNPDMILKLQKDVQNIYLDKKIEKYVVSLTDCTRHPEKYGVELGKYISYGGSPRSTIGLFIASKAHACVNGRTFVTPNDVKQIAHKILRHRIILNYEGQADEISSDEIIDEILQKVPIIINDKTLD